jgi:D-glycero-D-manno-heptose 1,7-bisphosphate phosphatase
MRVKQAVFLVGGTGTRLGARTATTPKPLIELAPGLRLLDVLLQEAARHGFADLLLLAGHLGEQVEALYQGRKVHNATVTVIREPEPAGTGGALLGAADRLDRWFLMANGDSLFEINLRALAAGPSPEFVGRLALRAVPEGSRYGLVETTGDRILSFREKAANRTGSTLISAGVYLLSRAILDFVRAPCSLETDVFPRLAGTGRLRGIQFEGYFLDIGLPATLAQAAREIPARQSRPAVFLDRDGVLNIDSGHVHRPEDLAWIPGARETVLKLNEAGYYVFVVTNQAGVARGYYGEAQVHTFHDRMQDELAETGAHVDAFYYCPFHQDAAIAAYRVPDHFDRKPNPGMILRALREWPVDVARSFLIGDRETDILAAQRANLPGYLFDGGDLRATVERALAQTVDRAAPALS